ncbi:glycerophosphodiester phosphodiesterase [Corynebacterium sp. 153RC1]|uniref:glycerophosphodiester phosphodiesterase family protein n=1 Tax=Corynebacterium TaxID=1716 RepID=UPI00211BE5DA|nr:MULTISPECIES: glycerophosphodiester phosphodiesterase family protein [unclassified Corynebacterium]MCQ9370429.1 glycerophosphodiester phosphodiesterase [Corynebacterium sp. 35RC1]MCQ9343035.1 glycerophosphodiester phosphodiesterase [Corynebacterium sp. 76QC2CO]MCQ9353274.1 glycerophosphodiester phosphodiesterase [Corynebacterium sp. 209RC1]MCQ9355414.1 glycerophosphodiester phosphodiesterase [Corynebacterium sp. 1222RC1]MCQ9357637.1 glycerophosphodiester phosphodiesterase [Corynebacterium s
MHIIAHRGFRGHYPEMSEIAFRSALEMPIHGVECDVRLSADGQVVCNHDATMLRTAGDPMRVSRATVSQLKRLNIGTQDEVQRVLTLDELLDIMEDYPDKHLYIETKHPVVTGPILEEQVALRLRYRGLLEDPRIHIISFSHAAIRRMAALAPHLDRIYLRREWELRYNPRDFGFSTPTAKGLSVMRGRLTPSLITSGKKGAYMWTVNKEEDMLWAKEQGVSMMATDFPDIALKLFG